MNTPAPTPFLHLANALPQDVRDALAALIVGSLANFRPSQTFRRDGALAPVDPTLRQSLTLVDSSSVWPLFGPHFERLAAEFTVYDHLGVSAPTGAVLEYEVTLHADGGRYPRHVDNGPGATRSRVLSFVYYLHTRPRRFTGGDLILYDGDAARGECTPDSFTRVAPDDNSLVFFPSGALHEVQPVAMPGLDLKDGRFTINGWVRAETPRDTADA